MNFKIIILVVFVVDLVRSESYYKHLSPVEYPEESYRTPFSPLQYRGYQYGPRAYRELAGNRNNYYKGDKSDGDYNREDVIRKTVHEAQDSAMKATSGAGGSHAVSVDSKGSEDYAGHSSGRGLQAVGEASSGKVQEYGTKGKEEYDGFGKAGFKKGHSESGFQKSYNKEESGKDSKFVDEDLKVGGETFVKSFGDKYGRSGTEGYGEAVKGYGYDQTAKDSGVVKNGLDSTGKHDIFNGEHGHKGGYDRGDSFVGDQQEGTYHDSHQDAGKHLGSRSTMKAMYDKPMYY